MAKNAPKGGKHGVDAFTSNGYGIVASKPVLSKSEAKKIVEEANKRSEKRKK